MPENRSFNEFMQRIRAGDQAAAAELVRQYQPVICQTVRRRLTEPGLYRQFDSMDICQSVMLSFFLGAAAGQYELDEPQQLLKLLVAMAQNQFACQARRQHRQRRDCRREVDGNGAAAEVTVPGPAGMFAGQELLQQMCRYLTREERQLTELRRQGHTWLEIAGTLGGKPQARRRQLTRALDRVARHLKLAD
jgi:RNA polymerase sigma factor (sigma-70 family)